MHLLLNWAASKFTIMKLYVVLTPSHEQLYREWFTTSLQDPYEIVVIAQPQDCPESTYKSPGWCLTLRRKVEAVIAAVQENWGTMFIVSDVDIQFFRPTSDLLTKAMTHADILFQKNTPFGELCGGFYICRANEKTLRFWQQVLAYMHTHPNLDDQDAANAILRPVVWRWKFLIAPFWRFKSIHRACLWLGAKLTKLHTHAASGICWGYLPPSFYNPIGHMWAPGTELDLPPNIVLHHANWAVGMPHKIAQLEYVKKKVLANK